MISLLTLSFSSGLLMKIASELFLTYWKGNIVILPPLVHLNSLNSRISLLTSDNSGVLTPMCLGMWFLSLYTFIKTY